MVSAYMYADVGSPSSEFKLISQIDRFGVEAVLGRRQLTAKEIIHMRMADNIVRYYQARAQSENWAEGAAAHKEGNRILIYCERLIDGVDTDQITDN